MKFLLSLALLMGLAACGAGYKGTVGRGASPAFLDDACAILQDRRGYGRAFAATQRKWGVPVHVQMAIIHQESKFVSDARTPFRYALGVIPFGRQSSAYGYSQALDGTWKEYLAEEGRGARRDRIADATDFMGWYMEKSRRELGLPMTDARSHYLAYHDGRTGYRRGTWKRKAWLVDVSARVASRASMYESQLQGCRRLWR
ncbi:lytic transglycosylase [Jannaschia sp. Os4]|uniref:transglycosylase SLT domain-containing protein n=1 Tax=Jannaschia sp. Os4 TaxID=2807617 RepID=UPI001939FC59|nr:lytic transglycosylase [Jannaschia sp. Os4]MBM2575865.1 lytic transglycosylase [Jannaschia sp. Os4]